VRRCPFATLAGFALALVAGDGLRAAEAATVLCQKRSGVIVVRDPACKKRETALDLAQFGAAGPSLVAHTQNVESAFPIAGSPTVVAIIGELAAGTYSGSYSAALVHPEAASYVAINVQAHVANVSGTGVACALEGRADAGAWAPLARTEVPSSEAFMNTSFPSFSPGTSWSFRVVCQTSGGAGTARGEIGVMGGVLD
jgi:hypothetical protein